MPVFSFLPAWPDSINVLAATGLILFVGILGARLIARFLPRMPVITGYVLTGLLIGPAGIGLIDRAALNSIVSLVDLGLGLVLFELGRRVDFKWLLREKRLLMSGIIISVMTFLALFLLLLFFAVNPSVAIMVAAIGMATSPAVILNLVREYKAEGQVSERMLDIVAIGNVLAFVGFSMGLSTAHMEYQAGWHQYVLHPLYLFGGSIALAWLASRMLIWVSQWVGRDNQAQLILILGLIAALAGISALLNLSALIALLAFGIISRSRDLKHAVIEADFSQFSALVYVVLFVFAGAKLEFEHLSKLWPLVLSFIVLRLGVAVLMTTALARYNGMNLRKGALLGVGLIPLSGFKIILLQSTVNLYPQFGAEWFSIVLSTIGILEIIGPICARYALFASGEAFHKGEDSHATVQSFNTVNYGSRT